MWKVQLPDNSEAISELITALTFKSGEPKHRLTADELKTIQELYEVYEGNNGIASELLKAEIIEVITLDAVHDAYNEVQEGKRLDALRSRLLLNTNRCPCCGILPADELDHYLPRSVFKILSVYSSNLLPICHKCNNKKRTLTGENQDERFIHVYYEKLPLDKQFFFATLDIINENMVVTFKVLQVNGMSDLLYKRLNFQIERVGLNKRLSKEINVFMSSFALSMKMAYGDGQALSVKRFLADNAKYFKVKFGLNDWRTTLLLALSENNTFCDGGFIKILKIEDM